LQLLSVTPKIRILDPRLVAKEPICHFPKPVLTASRFYGTSARHCTLMSRLDRKVPDPDAKLSRSDAFPCQATARAFEVCVEDYG